MKVRDLREKYLAFFESKGHQRVNSGSLVPYDVTGRLDDSLLFNGAGMVQFKPYFRGIAQPSHPRLTNSQKCVRTGDIDEVGDATHLTFFEMLGNFSFGDYFKAQAIAYSWEFLTSPEWLGLDPRRLSFTVFESDDEAYAEWERWLIPAGIDPATRIVRLGEETNYWPAGAFSKGPPGPCGPNSEMFYWVSPEPPPRHSGDGEGVGGGAYSAADWIRDEAAGKWVEIWNDVFIQYEWQGHLRDAANPKAGYEKDAMPNLPFASIDTGMGLERTAMALSGGTSVYDSDVFAPIFGQLEALLPSPIPSLRQHAAARVIADHIRTACFCIADGVLPSNNGRGYVLRRLIRRAVLKGQRALGFDDLFLYRVYEGVVEAMGDHYTELVDRREVIVETLRNEEAQFRRTLRNGEHLFAEVSSRLTSRDFPGEDAFVLYDTYGFPLEVTQELAQEAGLEVDLTGYERALKEAQARSRGGQEIKGAYEGLAADEELAVPDAAGETEFLGYTCTSASARIVRVRPLTPNPLSRDEPHGRGGSEVRLALDRTPFYAASGGQISDRGVLRWGSHSFDVVDVSKSGGTVWHTVALPGDTSAESLLGQEIVAEVQNEERDQIRRHHTATHLLHAALRKVLGTHVTQAGSYVGPDNLRFDFTHGKAMTPDEIEQVEELVYAQVLANTVVDTHVDLPIDEARARGAMALFGEKYGDRVRMVEIGEFSRELCGGIHVKATGDIGLFAILSEGSAASGVRRIEAAAGWNAFQLAKGNRGRVRTIAEALKIPPAEVVAGVEKLQEALRDERKRREKAEMAALSGGPAASSDTVQVGSVTLWRRDFGEADPKLAATAIDDAAAGKPAQVTLGAVVKDGKPQFIAKVGAEAVAAGAHAGNLLREVAKIAGGGGGGRAEFATAGGRDASKVSEALAGAEALLREMLIPST